MYSTKTFRTRAAMQCFIAPRAHRYQFTEIFVNNGYGVEYRPFRVIDIN